MFHPTEDFHKYIHPGKRVHLAGIGGVSMCALAEVLQGMGVTVQGSDMSDSDTVKHRTIPNTAICIFQQPTHASRI